MNKIEIPTNWQTRKMLKWVKKEKEKANTQASETFWSLLESEIESELNNE
jgi:hypothetical protein